MIIRIFYMYNKYAVNQTKSLKLKKQKIKKVTNILLKKNIFKKGLKFYSKLIQFTKHQRHIYFPSDVKCINYFNIDLGNNEILTYLCFQHIKISNKKSGFFFRIFPNFTLKYVKCFNKVEINGTFFDKDIINFYTTKF